jgi:ubiquitin-protein ligase
VTTDTSTLTRLGSEHELLRRLADASNGHVVLRSVSADLQTYDIELHIKAPVGTTRDYTVADVHVLTLSLPDGFPEARPHAIFDHPIFVPNVWASGVPCIVAYNWFPSQHLDQVICDLIEEIQGGSPNYLSVANREASDAFDDAAYVTELKRRLGAPVILVPPPLPTRYEVPAEFPAPEYAVRLKGIRRKETAVSPPPAPRPVTPRAIVRSGPRTVAPPQPLIPAPSAGGIRRLADTLSRPDAPLPPTAPTIRVVPAPATPRRFGLPTIRNRP